MTSGRHIGRGSRARRHPIGGWTTKSRPRTPEVTLTESRSRLRLRECEVNRMCGFQLLYRGHAGESTNQSRVGSLSLKGGGQEGGGSAGNTQEENSPRAPPPAKACVQPLVSDDSLHA